MASAFQSNAFQNNAFQTDATTSTSIWDLSRIFIRDNWRTYRQSLNFPILLILLLWS